MRPIESAWLMVKSGPVRSGSSMPSAFQFWLMETSGVHKKLSDVLKLMDRVGEVRVGLFGQVKAVIH